MFTLCRHFQTMWQQLASIRVPWYYHSAPYHVNIYTLEKLHFFFFFPECLFFLHLASEDGKDGGGGGGGGTWGCMTERRKD